MPNPRAPENAIYVVVQYFKFLAPVLNPDLSGRGGMFIDKTIPYTAKPQRGDMCVGNWSCQLAVEHRNKTYDLTNSLGYKRLQEDKICHAFSSHLVLGSP